MSELLPCPFCGGEAHTHDFSWHASQFAGHMFDRPYWQVICSECRAAIGDFDNRAEAIEAWNTRAERTCKFVNSKGSDRPPVCSKCGYELSIYDCEWFEDGTYGYDGNYCPNCGARVIKSDQYL